MGEQMQLDDLTMLALRRRREKEPNAHFFQREATMPNLALFREFVEDACELIKVEQHLIQDLKLAVDEVCANLIHYAYSGQEGGKIKLRIMDRDPLIEIRVEDTGHPFDPEWVAPPNLSDNMEERKIGGLGLFLVKETMDEVSYESHDEYNVLILRKRYKQS